MRKLLSVEVYHARLPANLFSLFWKTNMGLPGWYNITCLEFINVFQTFGLRVEDC